MAKGRSAVGGDKGKDAKGKDVKRALARKAKRSAQTTSASSLLEDVNSTTLVLIFIVCALSSFLFFQWKLKQSSSAAFVNPYGSMDLTEERAASKELVERSGSTGHQSTYASQAETNRRVELARQHWEKGEYDEALEQIEILEAAGWVSPGVLNNKGVIAWDAKQYYRAFVIFCDALDRSTVGPLKDVMSNMIGMWSESGFTFSDTVARDRVANHFMAGVKQLAEWKLYEKIQACRFMFRNGANDLSVKCYQYLLKVVPADDSHTIDIMHNLGMAMVFQDDPDGLVWLKKSQLAMTRSWPFFEDKRPIGKGVDNIMMLHPATEHPEMHMSLLDTSSRDFGVVPGQFFGDNRPVPAELAGGALGIPPFSMALMERPITMIEMHDILFEEPGIFHKGREILLYDLGVFQFLSSWKERAKEGDIHLQRVEEDTVIFVGAWASNYYHWLVESLSRIALAMEFGTLEKYPTAKFLIVIPKERTAPPAFVTETLRLMNVPEDRLIYMRVGEEQVLAKTLLYACFGFFETDTARAIHTQIPTAIAVRALRERLVPEYLRVPKSERNKVVYISRADQVNRRTLFDDSLIPTLRNLLGEERVVVHGDRKMSVEEQREMFSEAILVVGGHGAGLANLIFCEPGTGVLEFPTETLYQQLYYSALSSALGLRFFQVPQITAIYYGPYFNGEGAVLTIAHAVHDALQVLEHGL